METVAESKKTPWVEVGILVAAAAILVWRVDLDKIIAGVAVAVGLGFVVFWHELGHFLACKWAGVKVLKFSIGFGPPILSFRKGMGFTLFGSRNKEYANLLRAAAADPADDRAGRVGETEYAIAALPLGGFVKMLGEDAGDEAPRSVDPRAYANKSVGARMTILSAGVVMNLLLGVACYAAVYLRGTIEIPARIGGIAAGSPAYLNDLRPGDDIVAIDGRSGISYEDLFFASAFSGRGQVVRLDIRRPGVEAPIRVGIHPIRRPGSKTPSIGIAPPEGLSMNPGMPFLPPAGMVGGPVPPFEAGDLVAAIGPEGAAPTPVGSREEVDRALARFADRPVVVRVHRRPKPAETPGPKSKAKPGLLDEPASPSDPEVAVVVPPNRVVGLGIRMAIGPIAAVRPGSVAGRAGFRAGDILVSVDGRADFDPLGLPMDCFRRAGVERKFAVRRPDTGGRTTDLILSATPDDTPPKTGVLAPFEPLDVTGLGLAYPVTSTIAAVEPGSAAATAALKPGDRLSSIAWTVPPELNDGSPRTTTIRLDGEIPQWQVAFAGLQFFARKSVIVTKDGETTPITLVPAPVPGEFSNLRGLEFRRLTRPLPPQGLATSLRRGLREAGQTILRIYGMIRGLVQGRVPGDQVGGIIRITDMAFDAAKVGPDALIPFLAMLSINLAVLNFLPIPPLDGGQIFFLVIEKIRGRPLPENAVAAGTLAGIALVLVLFVVVTFNDIKSYFVN